MTHEALARALSQITTWMREHEAAVLADNLAPGASEDDLLATETTLGFALPTELRALYALHDGQHDEMNGFVEWRDLLSLARMLGERETVDMLVELCREDPADARTGGMTVEELTADAWLPFAGRDSDFLIVHAVTGRVFELLHDDLPPRLIAASLVEWAQAYAARVVADDYRVEEGFGDCYLELRDRAREAAEAAKDRAATARAHALATAPLAELVADAIAHDRPFDCVDVLDAAEKREALAEAVALVFSSKASAAFVAEALRTRLRSLSLSASEWRTIADGGAKLGNDAIVALARDKLGPKSDAAPSKPWWKVWS